MKHLTHQSHSSLLRFVALAGLSLSGISSSYAAITVLHNFSGTASDGSQPFGGVTRSGTKLYGTTNEGGTNNTGVLYSMNTNGSGFAVLHSFTGSGGDGKNPQGNLAIAGSTLYGMTHEGGATNHGTIFKSNTDGTGYSVLHNFANSPANGINPHGSLLVSDTKLFGLAYYGGTANNGVIFSLDTDGTDFSVLHSFTGSPDGKYPYSSLTLSGSTLYGTVTEGGTFNKGGIFKIDTDGTDYGMIYSFSGASDGRYPSGSLTISGSTIYGTAAAGGSSDLGTIYSLQTDGSNFNLLHSFAGGIGDGQTAYSGLTLSGQKLYGLTYGGGANSSGTLYSIDTDGTDFAIEESLGGLNGSGPWFGSNLAISEDTATLYGVARNSGAFGAGVVFSTDIEPVPEPGTAFFGLALVGLAAGVRRRKARV